MRRAFTVALVAAVAVPLGAQTAPWRDPSPHTVRFVDANGVRLHVLDWGGSGPLVVLLPGYGMTAHIYDEVGPLLARGDHHVVAITPRGFGESSAPDSARYTIEAAAGDLGAVLDALHAGRASLVAHSFSGQTITRFAALHPARVTTLIYLDAFPDYSALGGDSVAAHDPVSPPPFAGDTTYPSIREWLVRTIHGTWTPALEADLRAKPLGAEGARRRALFQHFLADQATHSADLTRVAAPAVEICALTTTAAEFPWLRAGTPDFARADRYVHDELLPFEKRACSDFARRAQHASTMEITGPHYVFFYQPEKTAQTINAILQDH